MSADAKLIALLRSLEVEEQSLLRERAPVEKIVEERGAVFDTWSKKREALEAKLAVGAIKLKGESLQKGNIGALAEWERFASRIKREIELLEPELVLAGNELRVAQDRLQQVDEELVTVRLERKRIERVIENREEQERIQNQALDEVSADELTMYKNRK